MARPRVSQGQIIPGVVLESQNCDLFACTTSLIKVTTTGNVVKFRLRRESIEQEEERRDNSLRR